MGRYPLFISLGTVLGIPLNAVFDYAVRHTPVPALKIGGCVMVVVGFVILAAPGGMPARRAGKGGGTRDGRDAD